MRYFNFRFFSFHSNRKGKKHHPNKCGKSFAGIGKIKQKLKNTFCSAIKN